MDIDPLLALVELSGGDQDQLLRALAPLHDLERKVLLLRLGLRDGRYWTLEEAARELGAPREQVRFVEGRAIAKLRNWGGGAGPAGVREPRRPSPASPAAHLYATLDNAV